MGVENLEYDELIKKYRELQLRVTRFSATEQALINTRDRLDQELEMYKRMQRYNAMLLDMPNFDQFFGLVCEAIVDVFELECAIYGRKTALAQHWDLGAEGWKLHDLDNWHDDFTTLTQLHKAGFSQILKLEDLSFLKSFVPFFEGIFFHVKDQRNQSQFLFVGLNSKANSAIYQPIQERHFMMFNVFMQNVQSIFSNHQRSAEIESQLAVIEKSAVELRKLSLIATKTKNGVIITDSHGHVEWVNEAFTKISGYSLDEVVGKKPKDFLQGKNTDEESRNKLSNALWNKEDLELTIVNYDKLGQPYYNQLEIISVFDEQGNHVNFIALQKDITQEIQSQQEMLKLNSRFKIITNHSKIGLWEWTAENDTVEWSDELYSLHGIDRNYQGDLRIVWLNSMLEDDRDRILSNVSKLKEGKEKVIKDIYRIRKGKEQAVRTIETFTVSECNEKNQVVRLVGSSKDVTEELELIEQRDQSLVQIDQLKSFYQNVLQNSPVDIIVIDSSGKLTYRNNLRNNDNEWPALNEYVDLREVREKETSNRMDGLWKAVRRALDERIMTYWEDYHAQTEEYYLYNVLPHYNLNGTIESIIISGVDISELKRAQIAMALSNDELRKINLELDNFVYSISHDLRSPLLSIKGIISLVLHDQGLPEKAIQFLNMADQSVTRLDGTIQEILEYSRNSRLEIVPEWMDLSKMVQTIFDDLKFITEDSLEMDLSFPSTPLLYNDKARISVLLKNIIGNSVKYRKPNAHTVIVFKQEVFDGSVVLTIQDNGQGIEEQHINKIFNMFFRGTSSSVGTGLGLYICQEIVNKLGGEITVESTKNVGTTMRIKLPIIEEIK